MTGPHNDISRTAAIGMFDGVHLGHRYLLGQLRENAADGLRPTVFTFANHPLTVINPDKAPCLLTLPDEKECLLHEEGIDVVMLDFDDTMRGMTSDEFITLLTTRYNVRRLLLGFNNHFGSDRGNTIDTYRATAARHSVDLMAASEFRQSDLSVSSTLIRTALSHGDIAAANRMLGRLYQLTGTVESGRRIGRTIGFPTANLRPLSPLKAVPAPGVYAADAICPDGISRRAIVNIGRRPTVENDGAVKIEAHIDRFGGDLYGSQLTLRFLARLRDEQRFDSLDLLSAQLHTDLDNARTL